MVEQLICNQPVGGSSPSTSSRALRFSAENLSLREGSAFQGEPVPPRYAPPARYPFRPPAGFARSGQVHMEEFPSGQRGQTVNLLRFASVVRIHPPPPRNVPPVGGAFFISACVPLLSGGPAVISPFGDNWRPEIEHTFDYGVIIPPFSGGRQVFFCISCYTSVEIPVFCLSIKRFICIIFEAVFPGCS